LGHRRRPAPTPPPAPAAQHRAIRPRRHAARHSRQPPHQPFTLLCIPSATPPGASRISASLRLEHRIRRQEGAPEAYTINNSGCLKLNNCHAAPAKGTALQSGVNTGAVADSQTIQRGIPRRHARPRPSFAPQQNAFAVNKPTSSVNANNRKPRHQFACYRAVEE